MTDTATKTQIFLARLAFALLIGFALAGAAWYGFSADERERLWQHLLERPDGPMMFRFILQPIIGAIAALRDGVADARAGKSPYLWTILTDSQARLSRLHEGLIATARIILLGLAMDTVFQITQYHAFYPGEAAIIAILLAFMPYVLLRGLFAHLAGWWRGGRKGA